MKFSSTEFVIDKRYAEQLANNVTVFQRQTKTKKTFFPTMITTYGVVKNSHYLGGVQAEVLMQDLFRAT
jgi:hypothetical protein